MRICGHLAMFLLLAWLAPRDSAGRDIIKERKKDVAFKGKFTGHAKERCTWTASGETRYTLKVTCLGVKKGKSRQGYTCEYTGEPALCPSYVTNPKAFWKQISRGLQQQKQHLCKDANEVVRARSCRNGPTAAHFRLINKVPMTTPAVKTGLAEDMPSTECTRRADHRELAHEKCGSNWANLCNFIFHMVQSRAC